MGGGGEARGGSGGSGCKCEQHCALHISLSLTAFLAVAFSSFWSFFVCVNNTSNINLSRRMQCYAYSLKEGSLGSKKGSVLLKTA